MPVQSSLDSFFPGAAQASPPRPAAAAARPKAKKEPSKDGKDGSKLPARPATKCLTSSDPPINDIQAMFTDLVSRLPQFRAVVERLSPRKLRVATMCSGTESPLLALRMIGRAAEKLWGTKFDVEHIFSCEIEPFKQAYIERNFSPPVLFRDVCELGNDKATTAYGALVDVPGHADMLIAGTSCVDYSSLNNSKQDITAKGESGETFRGMMSWVKNHRPPIVILENVCSAPWEKVVKYFEAEGYAAISTRVDTKKYYIPHTRTRGYLVAFDTRRAPGGRKKTVDAFPGKWKDQVVALQRPASSPFDQFLLPGDDPRIHAAREKLVKESAESTARRERIDWGKCESRHQKARLGEDLGTKRPFTMWEEGGRCHMLSWTWHDWGITQVERVWDLLDITVLRHAQLGVDPSFKTVLWNLSQNVDRSIGDSMIGICPCLTPTMIPYVTTRGGPITGLEALGLQGLPVNELLLTTETEDNLADLAGNAMSTTVVGASMISALTIAMEMLDPGEGEMEVDEIDDAGVERHVQGEDQLTARPLDLAPITASVNLTTLLAHAGQSARKCVCEGRAGVTTRALLQCLDCGFTACEKCAGRPPHRNVPLLEERIDPAMFERELKSALPMCVRFSTVGEDDLEDAFSARGGKLKKSIWEAWKQAALRAVGGTLRFTALKRQEIWVVRYESVDAVLTLSLDPATKPEWALFARPDPSEPANSAMRDLLTTTPILRSVGGQAMFDGSWEWGLPTLTRFELELRGTGELVPAWQATLGLQGEWSEMKVWSAIEVRVPAENVDDLDVDVTGEYVLFQNCGTATNALHKRAAERAEGGKELFFFFDPSLEKELEKDTFVFSSSVRKYDHGEARPVFAKLDPKWRQGSGEGWEKVGCTVQCQYTEAEGLRLEPDVEADAVYAVPTKPLTVDVSLEHCVTANAVLTCSVPLRDENPSLVWPREHWGEVDTVHERTVFQELAWLTQRITSIKGMDAWQTIETDATRLHECDVCAPRAPGIKWARKGKKMVAFEDIGQAGQYEQALKNRPRPFVTQLRLKDEVGEVRIGINFASLIHRALSRLPTEGRAEQPCLTWRLTTDYAAPPVLKLPKFTLRSNKQDTQHTQPPNFILKLRPEQRRSLTWMLAQESVDVEPFVEEEVAEAALEALGWRAEGRATRTVHVRGGVLADQVGYGKTAITLGLVDAASGQQKPDVPEFLTEGRIRASKTTLIVVPPHLVRQWPSEVEKFLGDHYEIITIANVAQLNKVTISDIRKAKLVIVASTIFKSNVYLQNLATFAGSSSLADCEGRMFNMRLDETLALLQEQVKVLRNEGSEAVWERISEAREKADKAEAAYVQSKRLKGKKYRETKANTKKRQIVEDEESDVESSGDTSDSDDEPAAKKRKKEVSDPWDLRTSSVRKNWMNMSCPPLECFLFERVVVDEYTYLEGKILALVCKIKSLYRWVLSGTPPVHDFVAVKTIAVLLDIHLGIDDYSETRTADARRRQKERTAAEKFHSFREVNSPAWHGRRHEIAQTFLNQFVRQNIAEIDEIPSQQIIRPVTLPAAERAIYLELEHHLLALDMTMKKSKKSESDRDRRLAQSLGDSKSAEEALLKRCAHFDLDMDGVSLDPAKKAKSKAPVNNGMKENAMRACDVIVNERERQRNDCKAELLQKLTHAVDLENKIGRIEEESPFRTWVKVCEEKGVGDKEASSLILDLIHEVVPHDPPSGPGTADARPGKKPTKSKAASKKDKSDDSSDVDEEEPETRDDLIWALREHTHVIRKLEKELTSRVRSLRYFSNVRLLQQRDVQQQVEGGVIAVHCPTCPDEEQPLSVDSISILSSCGHMGCDKCVRASARREECVYASDGCKAAARELNIVRANTLGTDESRDRSRKHYGMKLEKIIDLIQNKIPKKERVLVFVQFPDLTQKVAEALQEHKIKFIQIAGTAVQQSKALESFQDPNASERVLLLNVMDEKASGANLTVANHAIFISPLLTPTKEIYVANETQAIGRILRYGQTKKVHIWRFLTLDSIDVSIYEERTGNKVDRSRDATVLEVGSLVDPRAAQDSTMDDDSTSSTASVDQISASGAENSKVRWVADYVEVPAVPRAHS